MFRKERPFQVGDEVALISGGWGRYIWGRDKVKKIYKTGNFVLERDKQQYKPDGYAAGEGRYRTPHVVHADSEVVQEIMLEKEFNDAKHDLEEAVDRLRKRSSPSKKAIRDMRKALKIIKTLLPQESTEAT